MLYRQSASGLARRINARVRSPEEATELVHEAFTRLIKSGSAQKLRSPAAFLNRILRNLLIDRSRRLSTQPPHLSIEEAGEPAIPPTQADEIEMADLRARYRASVDALPDRMRCVFILHRVDGLTYREIGLRLDISARTAEWHVAQAIIRIHKELERE